MDVGCGAGHVEPRHRALSMGPGRPAQAHKAWLLLLRGQVRESHAGTPPGSSVMNRVGLGLGHLRNPDSRLAGASLQLQ